MPRGLSRTTVGALLTVVFFSAPAAQSAQLKLGTVSFSNGGNAAAQAAFQRGIAQLHSFVYEDAADSFREAQRADPSFALAHWFEAFTFRQPLWGSEDLDGARRALARLGSDTATRLSKAPAARDRAYGEAIEALFAEGDEPVRARRFADAMRHVNAAYPDDLETMTFTSLAILGSAVFAQGRDRETLYNEAETLARRAFARERNHPGAAHYLIHADDTPERAPRAVDAARAYAHIAPDAVHALHMPAHTFVQLGLWTEAAESTEHAWAVSRAQVQARHQSAGALSFHDLLWVVYVEAQQGRYAESSRRVGEAREATGAADMEREPDAAQYGLCFAAFAHAAETGDWGSWNTLTKGDPGAEGRLTPPGANATVRARNEAALCTFNRAVAAAFGGDPSPAAALAARLSAAPQGPPGPGRFIRVSRTNVLLGLVARKAGDHETAMARFADAAAAEDNVVPLGPQVLPAWELLGEEQLAAGRAQDAVKSYEASLARGQNRSLALLGLARAKAKLGDTAGARNAYQKLAASWTHADPTVPARDEVTRGAAAR